MIKVKIGNKLVGDGGPVFISLEPGATYTGIESAKKLLKAVADSGADAVKFQTFITGDADRMMGRRDIKIDFTTPTGKKQERVHEALKRRELSREEWKELRDFCRKQGILFISSPYFVETVDFLQEIKVDAIKISKGDINNIGLIDYVAKKGIPVILDGREKFEDVENAVEICEKNGNKNIIIMHCPSGYPVENLGVHLRAISTMREIYDYPIGYADHSMGGLMNYAAVAMGANFLEKTITLDKTIEKVEHFMSLEPQEFKEFIESVRAVEQALGNSRIIFKSRVEENARRSFVAKREIRKGEKITFDILDFKRPGNAGISCAKPNLIIGKTAIQDINKDEFIQLDMIK